MTHRTRTPIALGAALAMGLVAASSIARAENPGPASIAYPVADAPVAEQEAYWRARVGEARQRVSEAQAKLDSAKADVSRMRRRNHPRGEPRAALFAARDAAQNEFDEARHHLEVELPEEAQQVGASPNWLE